MLTCPKCNTPLQKIDIQFDYKSNTVTAGGRTALLRPTQLHILECLIDAYPFPAWPDQIYDELYGKREAERLPNINNIGVQISGMREVLERARFKIQIGRMRIGNGLMGYLLLPEHVVECIQTQTRAA